MAMRARSGEPGERPVRIPLDRLMVRTARLSSPAIVVIFVFFLSGHLGVLPALAGLAGAFAFGALLAHARERRLLLVERQLRGLMELADQTGTGFELLGGDALPAMTEQVEQSLQQMRARQDELDQTLSALVDAIPDPLLLVQADHNIARANVAAARLFERDSDGQRIESVLRDPGLLAAIDDVLDGSDQADVSLQLTGPPTRAFAARVVPCRWHGRAAALISLRELTEQVAIERMRSDFVANASHELRTPLTVIRGFVETLAGSAKDDPEAQARFLKTMGIEAERMSRLVNDLLSLSKIEQNEHVLPDDSIDVMDTIGGVVDVLRPYAQECRVALKLEAKGTLPEVLGDRDQLSQLFTNLIDNAIKYGGENSDVTITACFVEAAPPGAGPLTGRSTVEVVIVDHGQGIAPQYLPRLTERFFRVDPAHSRRLGGTGLGLAIVKHILRRHRGHMTFESEVGVGTEVTVYLVIA